MGGLEEDVGSDDEEEDGVGEGGEGHAETDGIGEHVAGIREQREGVGDPPCADFGEHEPEDEHEGDGERAEVSRTGSIGAGAVVVAHR